MKSAEKDPKKFQNPTENLKKLEIWKFWMERNIWKKWLAFLCENPVEKKFRRSIPKRESKLHQNPPYSPSYRVTSVNSAEVHVVCIFISFSKWKIFIIKYCLCPQSVNKVAIQIICDVVVFTRCFIRRVKFTTLCVQSMYSSSWSWLPCSMQFY